MVREFYEETGLTYRSWAPLISLEGSDWLVHFYCGRDFENNFEYAETKEQEEVAKIDVDRLDDFECIDNLRWLIPMAIEKLSGMYINMFTLNQADQFTLIQSSNEELTAERDHYKALYEAIEPFADPDPLYLSLEQKIRWNKYQNLKNQTDFKNQEKE